MQPLTPCVLRPCDSATDHQDSDAAVADIGGNHDVLDPGVNEAVPNNIDKADQRVPVACDHPAKAVPVDLTPPVLLIVCEHPSFKRLGVQRIQLFVSEIPAPVVVNTHAAHTNNGGHWHGDRFAYNWR